MPSAAPMIETARLRLRPHRSADFDELAALWADPAVTRFIGGKPSTREESWARLLRYGGLWPLLGFGYWAVEEMAGGRYIGDVGFMDAKREMTPSIAGMAEAGWVLRPDVWGRGFATEAVQAALGWADRNISGTRIVCIIDPANAASLRNAARCSFVRIADAVYKDAPILLLERLPHSS